MKRELIENVKVLPYTLDTAIDREGFLSAVLAVSVSEGTTAKVAITHCDTDNGSYEAVPDDFVVVGKDEVSFTGTPLLNFDIDLVGCKRYIKINVTGPSSATYALVLGDASGVPVVGDDDEKFIRVPAKAGECKAGYCIVQ